jgi:hypothetical protein
MGLNGGSVATDSVKFWSASLFFNCQLSNQLDVGGGNSWRLWNKSCLLYSANYNRKYLYKEKIKENDKKKLIPPLPILALYAVKPKAQSELCAPYCARV